MGCMPEKTMRGDSIFVETFRIEESSCVCTTCVLLVRTSRGGHGRWRDVGNLIVRGIWKCRIRDVEKQARSAALCMARFGETALDVIHLSDFGHLDPNHLLESLNSGTMPGSSEDFAIGGLQVISRKTRPL